MSRGHPEFFKILEDIGSMHNKKSANDSVPDDIFVNIIHSMVRTGDEVVRLQNAAANGSDLRNEGVEGSSMNLASCAIIALILYREGKISNAANL
jgi:hypothetical protein